MDNLVRPRTVIGALYIGMVLMDVCLAGWIVWMWWYQEEYAREQYKAFSRPCGAHLTC